MKEGKIDPWGYTTGKKEENSFELKSERDLDPLMERIGDAKYVLLGEASHGTHEYYTTRSLISIRLIEEKGFNFIAVEGDWPACFEINRFVKGYSEADLKTVDVLKNFHRWPSWMWANWEIAALIEWMRDHNRNKPSGEKVGFYGLDVYSLWESLEKLLQYLERTDKEAAELAKKAFTCFEPYSREGQEYARALMKWTESCKDEVVDLLKSIQAKALNYNQDPEATLNAEQNAFVAANAEMYYRSMIGVNRDSWNIRDRHMADTLNRLMKHHGPDAKTIVWEHNTHIGDARATDMSRDKMINVGQVVREEHEQDGVVLVGFGSYKGTVIAGSNWGAPMQIMNVPPAREGSIEEILHSEGASNRLLIFNRENRNERWSETYPHRAIGVVYHPTLEKHGNYVPSVIAERYDAFIFLDETKALHPLQIKADEYKVPETFPFGF